MSDYLREHRGFLMTGTPFGVTVATKGQGGRIPNVLLGLFTTYSVAQEAIDRYLDTPQGKGKNASKANSTSGDQ